MDIQTLFLDFCKENDLTISLSNKMPSGYETAYGTYDVTTNTLFLNRSMLQNAPEYELLFYFYHELRHAVQYRHPERFHQTLQASLPYVILYNGTCFRLVDNTWHECVLPGDEAYFVEAYLNLPYELDANNFAYQTVSDILGYSSELEELYAFWIPKNKWSLEELRKLFLMIDDEVCNSKFTRLQ